MNAYNYLNKSICLSLRPKEGKYLDFIDVGTANQTTNAVYLLTTEWLETEQTTSTQNGLNVSSFNAYFGVDKPNRNESLYFNMSFYSPSASRIPDLWLT